MPGMDNAHALIIGIANYRTIHPLPQTVLKDAKDIYDVLVNPNYCGYKRENVQLLLDQEATGDAIRQALSDLAAHSDQDSNVFFYLSSHGGRLDSGPHADEYILPVDVNYAGDSQIAQTAISGDDFAEALRAIPARKVTILFDCCHAGGIGQPKDATAPTMKGGLSDQYYERLKEGRGRAILASSRSDEQSWVRPGAANSLFTQHLLAGLQGGIASEDGLIRIFDLFEYLQPKVTSDQPNQHPVFKAEIEENFAVSLCLGGQKQAVPPPPSPQQSGDIDARALRIRLLERCSVSDLSDLCYELDLDRENYSRNKQDLTRELLIDLERKGMLDDLIAVLREQMSWVLDN